MIYFRTFEIGKALSSLMTAVWLRLKVPERAIQALHGKEIGTRTLTVSEARPHEEPAGSLGGGRGSSHTC